MISYGHNITSNSEPLSPVGINDFFHQIQAPLPDTAALIRQLRTVKEVDAKRYGQLKRKLPYYTCGIFDPAHRNTINFAYTNYFILDIDHLSEKGLALDSLRQRISTDSRVLMAFASPSMDGLKVMFHLSQHCSDPSIYSIFYRKFAYQFSVQYGVEQAIDMRTCDVTRACFASHDPDVYYNPQATPVNIADYVNDEDSMSFAEALREAETISLQSMERDETPPEELLSASSEPCDEVMANIRTILNPRRAKADQQPRPVYVPAQLEEITEDLCQYVANTGVEIVQVRSIQYGKKILTRIGSKAAETNVFYGRNGFTVVMSPKRGTDPEVNTIVAELIESFFDTL